MKTKHQKPQLKAIYQENIVPRLKILLSCRNEHQVPFVEKIVINSRISSDSDGALITETFESIRKIAGQRPIITSARDSISNFKLRKGMPTGIKVTLRGNRMYEFLYTLITVVLPAIRDFRGLPNKFDGNGNYTIGIADHTIFPQIIAEPGRKNIGMDITIVTTATTDKAAKELLSLMHMPFRKSSPSTQQELTASAAESI